MQDATRFFDSGMLSPSNTLRALAVIAALTVAGCSGGSGASTSENPITGTPEVSNYSGPAPATADVQSFKLNLWDNIVSNNRCGACHSVEGGQPPMFARSDDINLAYADANGVVTLSSPADSEMVTKVGGGHNCWLTDNAACASILSTWITNWAGDAVGGGGRTIELKPPPVIRDPGASKHFPPDPTGFQTTVYQNVLSPFCSGCHASDSAVQQSPFFAEGPPTDPNAVLTAYEAAKSKINLDDPAASRLVIRLRDESHNCWTTSCANDADFMEAQINAFAGPINADPVDPSLLTSKALTLYEGTIAAGGNRYEANTIALYEFKTGQGPTAFDTSGVDPAMDLTISGDVDWFGGWGLNFKGGKAQASTAASTKLNDLIKATGEYSVEAWVVPANVVQEDTRIVSYSGGTTTRNFNLGQTMYNYDHFNRTDGSDANGNPQLSTPAAAEVLQASLQHVVVTFDPVEGRKIFVNGVLVQDQDPAPGGSLTDWDDTFAFVLGNEVSNDRTWLGVIRLVAIHNRALTPAQIVQNFDAGVGEKFFLLFSVEDRTNVPDSYVVFEAAQFDSYAYLFRNPFFISLDGAAQPDGINIDGVRIGLNGQEAVAGQAFAKMNETISSLLYDPATGQSLADLGAVLPLENGPDTDEFFLTFDAISGVTYNRPPPVTPPPPVPQDLPEASDIGMRTFDEINASFAAITGVSPQTVGATYNGIRQSLPTVETIEAFLASHQTAVTQLALNYCSALMDDVGLRSTTFPLFNFSADAATAFPANQNPHALFDPLMDRVLGIVTPSAHQPDRNAVRTELEQLVNGIPGDPTRPGLTAGGGPASRTLEIAKGSCAALLGSAAMVVQ